MTEQRHPDIEIYIKSRSVEQIETWLGTLGDVTRLNSKGLTHDYTVLMDGQLVPVMLHEKVAGKAWLSLWFKENLTPWAQDLGCAHAAATAMETQIRCVAAGWNDGDEPDEYWKVENGQQEKIIWRS
ncbi:MAG: hypothetical protein OIF57_12240 [Marinobacterium sp.]|nr:hypothetical protein [Marinobacterium sp.]